MSIRLVIRAISRPAYIASVIIDIQCSFKCLLMRVDMNFMVISIYWIVFFFQVGSVYLIYSQENKPLLSVTILSFYLFYPENELGKSVFWISQTDKYRYRCRGNLPHFQWIKKLVEALTEEWKLINVFVQWDTFIIIIKMLMSLWNTVISTFGCLIKAVRKRTPTRTLLPTYRPDSNFVSRGTRWNILVFVVCQR